MACSKACTDLGNNGQVTGAGPSFLKILNHDESYAGVVQIPGAGAWPHVSLRLISHLYHQVPFPTLPSIQRALKTGSKGRR